MKKWGGRKWGAAPVGEPVRLQLGEVVMRDGDPRPWIRTTRRGYVVLWTMGYRGPS